MEVGFDTIKFYGELVEAAISKDIQYMVKLINILNEEEMRVLSFALLKITIVTNTVIRVRKDVG